VRLTSALVIMPHDPIDSWMGNRKTGFVKQPVPPHPTTIALARLQTAASPTGRPPPLR
jgi:hypothetical protein